MLREVLTVSALILAVLLVRAIFKNRVPKRMVYTLWLVVLVKLCLPGTLVSLPVLPAEEAAAPVQRVELPAQPLPAQQPAQAVTQPQTPVQQPVSPVQEAAKPAAKPLTATQIFQIIWAGAVRCSDLGYWARGWSSQFGFTRAGVFLADTAGRVFTFPARSNRRALQGSFRRSI